MAPKAVLVGLPGSGKTTIGRRLSKALGVGLLDTDVAIEERTGRSGRFKVNAQIGLNTSVTLAGSHGRSEGSGVGAGPGRAPETTWKEDGREDVWTTEGTVILSSDFYLTANLGSRPVNSAPHQPMNATTSAAMVRKYSTKKCGMIMINRMSTVQRRCRAGPATESCTGSGASPAIGSGGIGHSY